MYYDFYSFRERPFNLTPDPRFIHLGRNHQESFEPLLQGIDNHAGLIALTGEKGAGKTTLLRKLLVRIDTDRYRSAFISGASLLPSEFLLTITRKFGINNDNPEKSSLLESLRRFLLRENEGKRKRSSSS